MRPVVISSLCAYQYRCLNFKCPACSVDYDMGCNALYINITRCSNMQTGDPFVAEFVQWNKDIWLQKNMPFHRHVELRSQEALYNASILLCELLYYHKRTKTGHKLNLEEEFYTI